MLVLSLSDFVRNAEKYMSREQTAPVEIENDGVRYSPYENDKYISGVTVCYQAPVHEHNGRRFGFKRPSHWVFYSFPTSSSDPFGYLCPKGCQHHNVTQSEDIVR